MKVSVIISNYNYARYLGKAIDSVVAQTYEDFELVVVDDGSIDNSRDVIHEYEQKYPTVISSVLQPNGGQASAFNAGFDVSKGDIICFLDADDTWYPNKLAKVVQAFSNPDVIGVMNQDNHTDQNDVVTDPRPYPKEMPSGDISSYIVSTGGMWCFAGTSGLSYRRSALKKIFPINPKTWRICADGAVAYPAAFLGRIEVVFEVLGSYRLHGSNNHSNAVQNGDEGHITLASIEMTNEYINAFLERIGRPERVNLQDNLSYRRRAYYLHRRFNPVEAIGICGLILRTPLYKGSVRYVFLVRFLMKSFTYIVSTWRFVRVR
jgi:glycosyltransferase involved in cell wall biosynthesis